MSAASSTASRPNFRPGQKVRCIRAGSSVAGWKSKLVLGRIYTVSRTEETNWLRGIDLVEAPIGTGPALYASSRFVLAEATTDSSAAPEAPSAIPTPPQSDPQGDVDDHR